MQQPPIELGEELGSGASGRVWRGRLREPCGGLPPASEVALKRLHPALEEEPQARSAFEREIVVGRGLRHPNLVAVIADGRDEEGRWLLMPYVAGQSLREVLEAETALDEEALRSLVRQLASALAVLHAAGWRHTDLKPENVRWTSEGRAVLMDLGFARQMEGRVERARPGSLPYLSPEQARGEAGDLRSDLFSLGVIAYEAATGVHPYGLDIEPELLLEAIGEARLLLPSVRAPLLHPWVDHLCVELCALDPDERPSAAAIERCLREGEASEWWRSRRGLRPHLPHDSAPITSRLRLPFTGRESELEQLGEALLRARAGQGAPVWIEGEPGVGKSRLAWELGARARARDPECVLLFTRVSEWANEIPAAPFLELAARLFKLRRDRKPSARALAEMRRLLPSEDADTLERALAPERADPSAPLLQQAIVRLLTLVASERPTILYLDDLVWGGSLTLEIVGRLIEQLQNARFLLVLGRRTETRPREERAFERLRETPHTNLPLAPWSEAEVHELVERVFHHSAPRLRIAHVLWERSGGSPALVIEILSRARAAGELGPATEDEGMLQLFVPPDSLAWPRSLSQALAQSFRSLPAEDRAWLQRLAVVGTSVEPSFLARAYRAEEGAVRAELARLARAGWVVREGAAWRFARPVQRQAAYGTLSEQRRARLHARVAAALASTERFAGLPALLYRRAFHLREAGQHEELLRLVPDLLQSGWGREHPSRLHALATWGLESIDALPPSPERKRLVVLLLTRAADAADRLGERESQRAWLDRLAELDLDADTDPELAGRVYLLHGRFASSIGDYGLARGFYHNAILHFGRAGQAILESEATRRLAYVQANVGALQEAKELALRAHELAATPKQHALSAIALAVIALLSDRLEAALEALDEAFTHLRSVPRGEAHGVLAHAHLVRGRTWRLLGRPRRALQALTRALQMARRAGEKRLEVEALARSGELLLEVERVPQAEERLREALLAAREIEDRRGEALASLFLGVLLAEQEQEGARPLLERSVSIAAEVGLARVVSLGKALLARAAWIAGEQEDAWRLIAASRELLDQHGAELGDRIVILGTEAVFQGLLGREREERAIRRGLMRAIARAAGRLSTDLARRRQRVANRRLLRAVLTLEGPIYPRSKLRGLPPS